MWSEGILFIRKHKVLTDAWILKIDKGTACEEKVMGQMNVEGWKMNKVSGK